MHSKCLNSGYVINDNNNLAPSLFRLLFFFGSCAPSEKYLGPKQSPPISHNDLKKDDA